MNSFADDVFIARDTMVFVTFRTEHIYFSRSLKSFVKKSYTKKNNHECDRKVANEPCGHIVK